MGVLSALLTLYVAKVSISTMFFICGRARSQQMGEDVTCVTSSFIDWNLAQPYRKRTQVDSPHRGSVMQSFYVSLLCILIIHFMKGSLVGEIRLKQGEWVGVWVRGWVCVRVSMCEWACVSEHVWVSVCEWACVSERVQVSVCEWASEWVTVIERACQSTSQHTKSQ